MSNLGKFRFQRMTLKIEGVLNNILSQKLAQNGYEFTYQKGPRQMQNFLHEEKVNVFVKLYHYILLTTLCGN